MKSNHVILLAALAPFIGIGGCSSSVTDVCEECPGTCEVSSTTPVSWSEQTALGSPAQLFASFPGTCQAPFVWDASRWASSERYGATQADHPTVVPLYGKSTITATVTLDTASARFLTRDRAMCPDSLEIDGVATLELPEGKVADHYPFTVAATAVITPVEVSFALEEAEFGAWIAVQKSDPASTLSMPVSVRPIGGGCSGHVGLSTRAPQDSTSTGAVGPLAQWSDTLAP